MDECFRCGISGEKTRLFDVISDEGIVKVCQNCSTEGNFLMLKRPTTVQLKDAEKKESYLKPVEKKVPVRVPNKEDMTLRDIVDSNLKIQQEGEMKPRPDLVDNFHWEIMRVRRARHISRGQFARDLGESETLIKMVEGGRLPEDDNHIINKIETYLNIKLRKPEFAAKEPEKKELGFDSVSVRNLTISDLKEMKEGEEEEIFANPVEVWEGDIEDNPGEKVEDLEKKEDFEEKKEEDLSQKDVDDLVFGRK